MMYKTEEDFSKILLLERDLLPNLRMTGTKWSQTHY